MTKKETRFFSGDIPYSTSAEVRSTSASLHEGGGEQRGHLVSFTIWPKDGVEHEARVYAALTAAQAAEQCAQEDYECEHHVIESDRLQRLRDLWKTATVQLGVAQSTVWLPFDAYFEFKRILETVDTYEWRASYNVRDGVTGQLWVIDVGLVPEPSFVAIEAREICMPPAVHVLWGGNVLCEDLRLRGVPRDWPEDQRWISLAALAEGAVEELPVEVDRCDRCWAKAPAIIAGIQQIGVKDDVR